ncbi:MAG: methyltransferase domain-containing protein [Sphingomonadales bacterium]|nr:methyltransferase domain-containing protein [Sphingomonadales bacterium]
MDAIYRRQRHVYDLTRKYYLLGRDRAIHELAVPRDGTVLEVGCGTARNLVAIARRYPRAAVFGIDISRQMLASARARIAQERLGARIFTGCADATGFDAEDLFGMAQFDRILFSYTLSMIPDWRAALRQAAMRLAPGGVIRIVDFGGQDHLPLWFRRGLRGWLARFDVTPRDELGDCLAQLGAEFGLATSLESSHRGYAVHARLVARTD